VGDDANVLRLFLTAGLSVALGGAVVSVLVAAAGRGRRDRLLGPAGPVHQPWDGLLVVGGFFALLLAQAVAGAFLSALWGPVVAYPILAGLILGLIAAKGGPSPFPTRRWAPNVVAGYLTWLVITPAVFLVFALATKANQWLINRPPDQHPLVQTIQEAGSWGWSLFLLQTVVLAPLVEELVFRGLLLPWLATKQPPAPETALTIPPVVRPSLILVLAVGTALLLHSKDLQNALTAGDRHEAVIRLLPAAFFVVLLPFHLLLPRLNRLRRRLRIRSVQHTRAIWASSALFAAFHAQVWPSPVPLFVLALGLGYLYLRTRSLIGPVVVHGLFNAVSAVYLLLGGPA
jgi:membrane protease YdiL (CAAX protease family)